jgi:hypothetical protein
MASIRIVSDKAEGCFALSSLKQFGMVAYLEFLLTIHGIIPF